MRISSSLSDCSAEVRSDNYDDEQPSVVEITQWCDSKDEHQTVTISVESFRQIAKIVNAFE